MKLRYRYKRLLATIRILLDEGAESVSTHLLIVVLCIVFGQQFLETAYARTITITDRPLYSDRKDVELVITNADIVEFVLQAYELIAPDRGIIFIADPTAPPSRTFSIRYRGDSHALQLAMQDALGQAGYQLTRSIGGFDIVRPLNYGGSVPVGPAPSTLAPSGAVGEGIEFP